MGNNTKIMKLEEVVSISRGKRVVKQQLEQNDNGYPVYQNSLTSLGYYDKSNCSANTPFVISAGAAGDIGYSNIPYWAADDCLYFSNEENIKPRYLYFFLMSKQKFIKSFVRKASIPRLSRNVLEKLLIPVPSLEEQERIVSILDKFDALVNDISKGLPAEINARKQQYEYYRDKLLDFKRLPNE